MGLNLGHYPDPHATKDNFEYCYGYGCTKKIRLGFSDYEWQQITKIFKVPSKNAKEEREKIGKTIALMEQYTGELANTKSDLAKAPIRRQSYQELDCIDETINTTKYLNFLADANFLKFHTVGQPVYKGLVLNGVYPHNSASVVENDSGDVYAIDSYIYANGLAPDIRDINHWRKYKSNQIDQAERLHRL